MKIRNYKCTDYLQVSLILRDAGMFDDVWDSEDNSESMILKDPESILVTEIDGEVVAILLVVPYGGRVSYLFRLAVKKEFRKQGIASDILEKAKIIARQRKISEVGLYVDTGNKKLQEFYRKRGFNISEKSYNYMWSLLE